jgi:hypothetical protein
MIIFCCYNKIPETRFKKKKKLGTASHRASVILKPRSRMWQLRKARNPQLLDETIFQHMIITLVLERLLAFCQSNRMEG